MSGSTFSEEMCHIIKWIILRGKLFEVAGYTFLCSYKFLAQNTPASTMKWFCILRKLLPQRKKKVFKELRNGNKILYKCKQLHMTTFTFIFS